MSSSDVIVRPLTEDLVPSTAALLADAFEVDPAYRSLFPGPDRPDGLREFFRRNLATHLPHRATHVATDANGTLVATLTVRPPGGIALGAWTLLRQGLLPFLWARGLGPTRRMLWLKRIYEALEAEAAGHAPHWHLHMMAVAPAVQGTGVGSAVLREVLARTVGTDPSRPTVLTTHLERNVVFYRRAGFEVTETRSMRVPGGEPYCVWIMRSSQSP